MEAEEIKDYHQMLLNNVYTQKLEHNEEQIKIWNEYKDRHKKIKEGLEVYPLSLSENCMIPIGKRAFMKGKLTHTNEILVSLGNDYFVKYSAPQAIALCNRRIAYADEILKNLEIERNFYEMKQILPLNYDAFGEEDGKNIIEYCNEDELDKWRIQHKQREKDYRQKLAELREKEKTDSEENIFKKLDELDLEELDDEICRLETDQVPYDDNLEDNEVYDESDDTSDSDIITMEMIQEELRKLKELQKNEGASDTSKIDSDRIENEIERNIPEIVYKCTSENLQERRVSFVEPCAVENDDDDDAEKATSQTTNLIGQSDVHDEDSEDEDDVIRIEFSHSSCIPVATELNTEMKSPADIYKKFSVPKSILKRSPNDMIPNQVTTFIDEDNSTETEDDDSVRCGIYNSVVKEVQDRKACANTTTLLETNKKEIVSRFKLSRAKRNDT